MMFLKHAAEALAGMILGVVFCLFIAGAFVYSQLDCVEGEDKSFTCTTTK